MPDTAHAIIYSIICVYLGGCVKGLTGFGFSLMAVATLVLVAPPSSVVPVVLLMNSLMNLLLVYSIRGEVQMKRMLPLVLAGVAGLPFGTYILVMADADILRIVIGLLILLSAAALLLGFRREVKRERLGSGLVGAAGGILNGSVSIGGPPVILFLSNLGLEKRTFRANLVAYFLCINLAAIPFYYAGGLLTAEVFKMFALLLPALALGGLTGAKLVSKVSERTFRRITLAIVMVAALMALFTGLRGLV
jgi:uncharacterized membrane protein YfcA